MKMGFFKKKFEEIKTTYNENRQLRKEEKEADKYSQKMAQSEARQIARKTRAKGIVDKAKAKEEFKTKRDMEYIKSGGFIGKLQRMSGETVKQSKNIVKGKKINTPTPMGMVGDNYAYGGLSMNVPETRTAKAQNNSGLSLNLSNGNGLGLNLKKGKNKGGWF